MYRFDSSFSALMLFPCYPSCLSERSRYPISIYFSSGKIISVLKTILSYVCHSIRVPFVVLDDLCTIHNDSSSIVLLLLAQGTSQYKIPCGKEQMSYLS